MDTISPPDVYRVTLPDGKVTYLPASMSPEARQSVVDEYVKRTAPEPGIALSAAGNTALDMGKELLKGAGMGVGSLLTGGTDPEVVKQKQGTYQVGTRILNWAKGLNLDSVLGPDDKAIMQGMGGGAFLPFGGIAKSLLSGGVGNLVGKKTGEELDSPILGAIAGALTGGAIGGAGARVPKSGEMAVGQVVKGLPESSFEEASRNIDRFASNGMKTATLAEAFPDNGRLLDLAMQARNGPGGEKLAAQVAGREGDLTNLNDRIISLSGGGVQGTVPAQVANDARSAAEKVITDAQNARSAQYKADLAGAPDILPNVIQTLRKSLLRNAKQSQSNLERTSYLDAADALARADSPGRPKTQIQAIADDLKQMKEQLNTMTAQGKTKLEMSKINQRYQDVQDILKVASPQYRTAEETYSKTSRDVIDPLLGSPIGDISGRNPNLIPDPTTSILSHITKDQTPATIPGIMQTLQGGTSLPSQLLPQIAQTMVMNKLGKNPLSAGEALRGRAGSLDEGNLMAVLEGANVPKAPMQSALSTSDALQDFLSPPKTQPEVNQSLVQKAVRPFTAAYRGVGAMGERAYNQQVASLLASPTKEALQRLQELAMFDPHLRLMMALRSAIPPLTLQGEQ